MLFVRFDEKDIIKGQKSFNHFNNEELSGICCFAIEDEDNWKYEVRMIADRNSNYVKFANYKFVLFEGSYLEDNFNYEGVIANVDSIIEKGELSFNEFGHTIKTK